MNQYKLSIGSCICIRGLLELDLLDSFQSPLTLFKFKISNEKFKNCYKKETNIQLYVYLRVYSEKCEKIIGSNV